MEERRLLFAIALSLLVLTGYQLLFAPPPRPPVPVASASPGAPTAIPSPSTPPPAPSPAPGPRTRPGKAAAVPTPPPAVVITDDKERRVEVVGPDIALAFSNRGARLISWTLNNFKDSSGRPEEMVLTTPGAERPLDLETGDRDLDERLRGALFRASSEHLELKAGGPLELRFQYAEGDLEAEKAVVFEPKGYLVEVRGAVKRAGQALPVSVVWGPGVGNPTPAEMEVQGYHAPQGVLLGSRGVERIPAEKIGDRHPVPWARWAGVESTHFAAMMVPADPASGAELRGAILPPAPDGKPRHAAVAAVRLTSGPSKLYVGPKDHDLLSRVGYDLVQVVPVGEWIGPIVIFLIKLLRWVYSWVGNYGWSIVLLTVLINLVMAPFRHYSIANGIKMAKLAPEMRVIQERYRKVPLLDPKRQEMQEEISALYARHGMSMGTQMAVGCLPILLTMPFLIAFYRVLQVAIELRGATFLWIPDLSQKDPYFITPVLMGVSMFFMQKMMPTSMDPAQQRIMMLMPLILSGMFLWAPAGLNLYWLASNLCSIVQQALTLRFVQAREEAAEQPKKDRRRG
jgi:YidC/Oxa1 family membrane protein insertase